MRKSDRRHHAFGRDCIAVLSPSVVIVARSGVAGANTPWYLVKWARGFGASEARAAARTTLANRSAKFRFRGVSALAAGAAQGTGTEVDWKIIHGNHPLVVNETLAKMMDEKLRSVGGIEYTA